MPEIKLILGDCLEELKKLKPESVNLIFADPPYNLSGENHLTVHAGKPVKLDKGDWDKIENVHEFNLKWIKECIRVLKPHGNVFVVIDDTYNSGRHKWKPTDIEDPKWIGRNYLPLHDWHVEGIDRKSLLLIPERFAIAMVDKLGFILRNKIIWSKKVHIYKDRTTIGTAMPESVRDRLCHTYEIIYHFVKNPKYWYDLDAVRIPHKYPDLPQNDNRPFRGYLGQQQREKGGQHPLGANPGDVIQINTEPLKEHHYAPYPTKLVEFLIKIGCPQYVCKKCGKPRERIIDKTTINSKRNLIFDDGISKHPQRCGDSIVCTVGWTNCGCNAGWTSGIVLDTFLGSGTTAIVALRTGRIFIGIELNREYCKIAYRRIKPLLNQQLLTYFIGD